jgi:hypothetical protein
MHPKGDSLKALERILGLDSDMNNVLATLKKYGIQGINAKEDGEWDITYAADSNAAADQEE